MSWCNGDVWCARGALHVGVAVLSLHASLACSCHCFLVRTVDALNTVCRGGRDDNERMNARSKEVL